MKFICTSLLILGTTIALFAQTKQIVQPKGVPPGPYPFSLGVISNGLLFVAGQVGTDPQTGKLVSGGVEAETEQTIKNIKTILDAGGVTLDDVVTVTVYLSNMDDFPKMNAVYQKFFKAGSYPARTTVGVAKLVFGASVELTMTAAVPKK
jgi:2-iminobutanoate/2-iminopropanoate deaminase